MLLSARLLVLLAFCAILTVKGQLADTDASRVSGDSPPLVSEEEEETYVVPSYLGATLLGHVMVYYYHYVGILRDWTGRTQDSYTLTLIRTSQVRTRPRLSSTQRCSIRTFSKARRRKAFDKTMEECKKHLNFTWTEPEHNATERGEESVFLLGCCRARHYGVLETCIKITFDGSDPDKLDGPACHCEGTTA